MSTIVVYNNTDFRFLISYFQKENGHALNDVHRHRAITICLPIRGY